MNIFSRLDQLIEFKGISKNEFRSKLGLSNSYMSKMKANSGNIGSQIIEKIVRMYPELNIRWLITGEGEMLVKNQDNTFNNNSEMMNCNECPYKRMFEKMEKDSDWYRSEIDRLNNKLDTLQATEMPQSKQKCA